MKNEILIQRLENMILHQKEHVKETEGIHLRAKTMLRDLQEIHLDIKTVVDIKTVGNEAAFKDKVIVTILPTDPKPEEKK